MKINLSHKLIFVGQHILELIVSYVATTGKAGGLYHPYEGWFSTTK